MFYPACKLIVIAEHFLCERICKLAEAEGAKGQTWMAVGGKGLHHVHPAPDHATVAEGIDNIRVEILCKKRETAEAVATRILEECFSDYPGILWLESIEILRPDRF